MLLLVGEPHLQISPQLEKDPAIANYSDDGASKIAYTHRRCTHRTSSLVALLCSLDRGGEGTKNYYMGVN